MFNSIMRSASLNNRIPNISKGDVVVILLLFFLFPSSLASAMTSSERVALMMLMKNLENIKHNASIPIHLHNTMELNVLCSQRILMPFYAITVHYTLCYTFNSKSDNHLDFHPNRLGLFSTSITTTAQNQRWFVNRLPFILNIHTFTKFQNLKCYGYSRTATN